MTTKEFNNLQLSGTRNRLRYLESTDWYSSRNLEQSVPIPQEILDKRQDARDEISELKAANTYAEISHLSITFS